MQKPLSFTEKRRTFAEKAEKPRLVSIPLGQDRGALWENYFGNGIGDNGISLMKMPLKPHVWPLNNYSRIIERSALVDNEQG